MGQTLLSPAEPPAFWISSARKLDMEGGFDKLSLTYRYGEGELCIHCPSFREELDSKERPQ